jgi:hypothetical protein
MAMLTDGEQKNISAHSLSPSRASGYVNTGNGLVSVTYTDVTANYKDAAGNPQTATHRMAEYILTKPPSVTAGANVIVIPNPKFGDRAKVLICDNAATAVNPQGYAEYVYTNTVNDTTGAVSGTASWKKVAGV